MKKIISVLLVFCLLFSCVIANAAFTALENDENIVRIGVFADSHVLDNSKTINDAIAAFESLDSNLDGIVMGGDVVANAPTELLPELYTAALADEKLSAWLENKAPVTKETRSINETEYEVATNYGEGKLVWVMGNHEFNTNNNDVAQPEAWKKFQDETGLGIRGNVVMGGYHFIYSAAQGYIGTYTPEDQQWMMDELEKVLADETYAGKPVFLVLHHAIPESYHDTTNGVNGSNVIAGHYSDEFISYVKSQPRIIEFSAHTHYPIQDPRMICQPSEGGFTAVQIPFAGNGSFSLDRSADIRTASQEDSYGQALMLEINKTTNVVTIKRLNLKTGEYIGNDWTVDVSDTDDYTDERYATGIAPEFSSGDVTASNITANTAKITFPAATKFSKDTDTSYAHIYDVKVINKGTSVVEFSKSMVSDYYKLIQADSFDMDVDNLDADTEYIASVTAVSPYGKTAVVNGEFTTLKDEDGSSTSVVDTKEVIAGVDDIILDGLSLAGSVSNNDARWQVWLGEMYYHGYWDFTPEYTGMYELSSVTSFANNYTLSKPIHVEMSVDDVAVGSKITPERKGLWVYEEMSFGTVLLEKNKTYKIKTTIYGGNEMAYFHSAKVSYFGEPSEDYLAGKEIITLNKKTLPDNAVEGTHNNYNGSRWRFWVEDTDGVDNVTGYIAWDITPDYSGVYEIDTYYGYLPGAKYSDDTPAMLEATIDDVRVGDICSPDVIDSANNRANHTVFGEAALEAGKTYRLRINFYGQQYNVYMDNAYLTYKRAAEASEFWKDSVSINGWEPSEKSGASVTENFGTIISQSNHYATYTVAPGEGFYRLQITYGAGSSIDADAPVTLKLNGKNMGTIMAPDNNCYWPNANNDACVLDMGVIKLKEGKNNITLGHTGASGAAYYSVGKVTVTAIEKPVSGIYSGMYVDSDNEIEEIEDGIVTAYARLPRSLNGQNVFVVFAIYETSESSGTHRLVGTACDTFTAGAAGEAVLTIENVTKSADAVYSYRVFYIDSVETLRPLF